MRRLIFLLFLLFTLTSLTILVGCQPLIIPPTPAVEGSTPPADVATPVAATTVTMDTVATTATAPVSETLSATVPLAESVAISETAVVSETVEEASPAPTSEPSEENAGPMLTVIVASLRVRAGPGTEYEVIAAATAGEIYPIINQANDCQWYQIAYPQLVEAWVAGSAELVSSDTTCAQLPATAISTSPPPDSSVAPTAAQIDAPVATPAPAAESPAQPADDPFPPEKGCLLLQNQLGPPLTFTFTRSDGSFSDTFEVTSDGDVPYCLDPGYYRVTVDAPPPWSSLNTEFQIDAGQRVYFPIRPQ
jgi:uncharacterized protein YraI